MQSQTAEKIMLMPSIRLLKLLLSSLNTIIVLNMLEPTRQRVWSVLLLVSALKLLEVLPLVLPLVLLKRILIRISNNVVCVGTRLKNWRLVQFAW